MINTEIDGWEAKEKFTNRLLTARKGNNIKLTPHMTWQHTNAVCTIGSYLALRSSLLPIVCGLWAVSQNKVFKCIKLNLINKKKPILQQHSKQNIKNRTYKCEALYDK